MHIKIEENLALINNKQVNRYTLTNNNGLSVSILNMGGIISALRIPGSDGLNDNIVLGFDDVGLYDCKEYRDNYPYWGAICGRVANRIGNGTFCLDGVQYNLNKNNNGSHLHGGNEGFDRKFWNVKVISGETFATLHLSYLSPDGEEFYPGNLNVGVDYTLNDDDTFVIDYTAETDKATPVNLTNHTYFNLSGDKNISDMTIQVYASRFTPLNPLLVPTGEIALLDGRPNDLRDATKFKDGFKRLAEGYDYNYILDDDSFVKKAATIRDEGTNREINVYTTQPAVQVYSGYYIPEINGKFGRYSGVAIETQHYPDSVNEPEFPNTILRPGEIYRETTIWEISHN